MASPAPPRRRLAGWLLLSAGAAAAFAIGLGAARLLRPVPLLEPARSADRAKAADTKVVDDKRVRKRTCSPAQRAGRASYPPATAIVKRRC